MEEIRKWLPDDQSNAGEDTKNREYIFFKVKYNHHRDVSNSIVNDIRDMEDIRECECVLTLPSTYSSDGDATPLILSFHGSGGRVSEKEGLVGGIKYVTQCVDAGYAALDVHGSEDHGRTIGCLEHLMAAYKAYRYVTKKYNLEKLVLVCGGSMGGQVTVNFINMFPSIVLAAGLFYPRLNMDSVEINGKTVPGSFDKTTQGKDGSPHSRIIELHQFPSEEWCEKNTIGFNPYKIRSFVNGNGEKVIIPPCPIKVWHGNADKTTPHEVSEEFVNSIRRGGCYAEIHIIDGLGHGSNHVIRQELLMWFNRFI